MEAEQEDEKFAEVYPSCKGDLPPDDHDEICDSPVNSPTRKMNSFSLKPRFDSRELRESLNRATNEERRLVFPYFEVKLYECTAVAKKVGWEDDVHLTALQLYHLIELKSMMADLSTEDRVNYETQFTEVKTQYPHIENQYELMKDMLHLVSGLAVKYGVYQSDNFNYRCTGRSICVQIIDLLKFNSDVYTLDLLWITNAVFMDPFAPVMEDCVREFGKVLMKCTVNLFSYLLGLNEEVQDATALKGFLTYRHPVLKDLGWTTETDVKEAPKYQTLSLPNNGLLRFLKVRSQKKLGQLVKLLSEFDSTYRQFEKAVIANFLVISNAREEATEASELNELKID